MVILPPPFVKTKYSGYFWNINEKRLYSIKVSGILRPLRKQEEGIFYWKGVKHIKEEGYVVSVKGQRRFLPFKYLMKLKIPDEPQVIQQETLSKETFNV